MRPVIYLALDQVLAIAYAYVLARVIPNRLASAAVHLWALPVAIQAAALGMAAVRVPRARRLGWWVALVACSLLLLLTVGLIVRVLISAAFLAGVYGAFGQAAAMSAILGVALAVEVVALVPIFQIKYLMSRAGRRAYAMQP